MGTADSDGFVLFFGINFCLLGLDGLDFGFLWVGILDFDGVWVGFGLVGSLGLVGMVGNGGGVVGNGLFGCFCYLVCWGFGGFCFFIFLFWVFCSSGILVGMMVIVCLVVKRERERERDNFFIILLYNL